MDRRHFLKTCGIGLGALFLAPKLLFETARQGKDWVWATGDKLTQRLWAERWWVEAKQESYFYDIISKKGGNGIIQVIK